MLKFVVRQAGVRDVVWFGLSFVNLARLQQGLPILVDGRELGLDHNVAIFAGETEEAMRDDLVALGVLPASVKDAGRTEPGERQTWRPEG